MIGLALILGAIRWLAPELCISRPERSSFASDVWAFGCVLLEIITQEMPWKENYERSQQLTDALADERNAPIFQEICRKLRAPKKLQAILCTCCTWSKSNRPSFVKLINELYSISDSDLVLESEWNAAPGPSRNCRIQDQFGRSSRCQTASTAGTRQRKELFVNKTLYSSDDDEDYR